VRTPKPPRSFWFARVVRVVLGVPLKAAYRVTLRGAENLPATGGVILAGNHVSYADPILLWCRSPRPVHFMARADLWEHNIVGWGLDHLWSFPVRRAAADREALSRASDLLQGGEVVGIFPAGSRFAAEGESHGGAAFLSIRNNIPVVPIGIAGTEKILPRGARLPHFPRVTISAGDAIDPAQFTQGGRKERVEAMTNEIMARISEQVELSRKAADR